MKLLNEELQNKRVILRLDLNVTIKDNQIVDDTKIKKGLTTLNYLLDNHNKVLIMSHLGKIKTEEDKKNNSLKIVCERLQELLNKEVYFVKETKGQELENSLNTHDIVLMENTRFEDLDGKKESSCDLELSKYWASLADAFVIDAFGTTHRCHASTYGIGKFIPAYYGFLIDEEIKGLSPIINDVKRPFVVIMGGAKVDDKVALIESLLERCDYLLVGGGIANTFLKANGKEIGSSLYSEEYVDKVKELIDKYASKIKMPNSVVVNENNEIKTINIDEISESASIYDIGNETVYKYSEILNNANTIFVNGTMGMYEDANYKKGTELLYQIISQTKAYKIAGGGDAVASVNKLGYASKFDFLSTGGGATLEYIADKQIAVFKD